MKYLLLLVMATTFVMSTYAQSCAVSPQSYPTIYTPRYTAVQGTVYSEISSTCYSDALSYMQASYPNATIQENPTSQYNCYSYAFHLTEGNTQKVWINPLTTSNGPNLSNYWTDGSFIQVCDEADADKAYYYEGDHAAVTTSSISGQYESKWGKNCRVIHAPTYCPYDVPNYRRQYYASTKVTGDVSNLCTGTRTFSAKYMAGATYTWTYSSGVNVLNATNQNYLQVERSGGFNGSAWVQLQISTPCSSTPVTIRKDFTVGYPTTTCDQIGNGNCYQAYFVCQLIGWQYVVLSGPYSATGGAYHLQVNGGGYFTNGLSTMDITTNSFSVYIPNNGSNSILVWAKNNCGVAGNTPYTVSFYKQSYGCYGSYYMVSPNPASSTVTVMEKDPEAGKVSENRIITELNIYDQQGTIQKQQKYGKVRTATINVSGLKTGIYFIEIGDGTYKERQQLIIQK